MEDGSKRDQDTWQAFPDKTGKIFALFYKIETEFGVWSLEFRVRSSEFRPLAFAGRFGWRNTTLTIIMAPNLKFVRRSPFTVHRSPFAVHRSPFAGWHPVCLLNS
jgi:hypothetical protein